MDRYDFPVFKHYISIDNKNRIIDGWSSGIFPEKDISNAICINDKGDYQFHLFPDGDENPCLRYMEDVPLYKWTGSDVQKRTHDEIQADFDEISAVHDNSTSTNQEKLRADLDYVMLMMGIDVDPN